MEDKMKNQEVFTREIIMDLMSRTEFKDLGADKDDEEAFANIFTQSYGNTMSISFKLKIRKYSTGFLYLWLLKEFVREIDENGMKRARGLIGYGLDQTSMDERVLNRQAKELVDDTIVCFYSRKISLNFISSLKITEYENYKDFIKNTEILLDKKMGTLLICKEEDFTSRNEIFLFYIGVKIISEKIDKLRKFFQTNDELLDAVKNLEEMCDKRLFSRREEHSGLNIMKVYYNIVGENAKDKDKLKNYLKIWGDKVLQKHSYNMGGVMQMIGQEVGVLDMMSFFFEETIKYMNIVDADNMINVDIKDSETDPYVKRFKNNKTINMLSKFDLRHALRDIVGLDNVRETKHLKDVANFVIARRDEEAGAINYVVSIKYQDIEAVVVNMDNKKWDVMRSVSLMNKVKYIINAVTKKYIESEFIDVKDKSIKEFSVLYEFKNNSLVDIREVFVEMLQKLEMDILNKVDLDKYNIDEMLLFMKGRGRELILEESLSNIEKPVLGAINQKKKI